jgi:hypothetical protein
LSSVVPSVDSSAFGGLRRDAGGKSRGEAEQDCEDRERRNPRRLGPPRPAPTRT